MIEVTEKAAEMIKQYLRNQTESSSIRIHLQEKGSKRPFLRMFFAEPGVNDEIIVEQGITFSIDKELLQIAKPIRIDYAEIDENQVGFQIISRLPMIGYRRR